MRSGLLVSTAYLMRLKVLAMQTNIRFQDHTLYKPTCILGRHNIPEELTNST